MSYTLRRRNLGDVISDLTAATLGLTDPKDQEALQLIEQIIQDEISGNGSTSTRSSSGGGGGFTLGDLVVPLKVFHFWQTQPTLFYAIAGTSLAALFYIVFELGVISGSAPRRQVAPSMEAIG